MQNPLDHEVPAFRTICLKLLIDEFWIYIKQFEYFKNILCLKERWNLSTHPIKIKYFSPDSPESAERVDSEENDEEDYNESPGVAGVNTVRVTWS